jgi:Mor family transcriptional regulator
MQPSDIEIYNEWMGGQSTGSIAKRYKLDKAKVRRIVNRAIVELSSQPKAVLELQDEEASEGRDVQEAGR